MPHERAKKTLLGLGLTLAGLCSMIVSPIVGTALGFSQVGNMGTYYLFYFFGFVALLFGVGIVLMANNLWGEVRR
jgi:hypothetical protein